MPVVNSYAAQDSKSELAPWTFERRDPKPNDVQIEILYCGVCHSDLHTARNEWGGTIYPCVPGHEIIGRVTAVGNEVTKFKRATWRESVVLSIAVLNANPVKKDWSSIAPMEWSAPIIASKRMAAVIPMAAIANRLSCVKNLFYGYQVTWPLKPSHLYFVQVSLLIRLYDTGKLEKDKK